MRERFWERGKSGKGLCHIGGRGANSKPTLMMLGGAASSDLVSRSLKCI